jgi:PAS domain S-box-containing protein
MMEIPVRILHIDDNYAAGGAVEMELERRQYPSSVRFVTKKAEFLDAIARQAFEVILVDLRMSPDFEGEEALQLARSRCPGIPCIVLAETLEEEQAIKAVADGAADYVLKDNLCRLVPAIERARADARKSRQGAEAEQKLCRVTEKLQQVQKELGENKRVQEEWRVAEESYRRVFDAMTEAAALFDLVYDGSGAVVDCMFRGMNPAFEFLVGAKKSEHLGSPASEFFGDVLHLDLFHRVAVTGQPGLYETYAPSIGKYIVISVVPSGRRSVAAILTDITERKEMEEALLRTQHRLSLTQEAARIGIFDWNITTGQTVWTPELAKLFGISVPGHRHTFEDWSRLIHPDDRLRVERTIRDWLLSDRNEERLEYQLIRPDGNVHWMELLARLVRDSEGRPIRMIGTNLDITERKRGEEALHRSNDKMRKILESIHDAFYSLDENWRFTYVNQRACELWKKKPEELIGQNIWEVFSLGTETMAYREMHRAMEEEREGVFETYSEVIKSWVHVRVYPTDEGIAVYVLDITDRKKAEESLRRSEQLYRAIGETINWGIWVCDPDGKNIYVSPSFLKMVGMTQEECSEFGWGNVLHPDDAEETIAAWKECSRTGTFWERAHRFKGADGKYHHVLARGIPVRDERGAITCWAGINLDIDEMMEKGEEMKRLVEQRTQELVTATQELESFSSSVPHDLKAPLRVIGGFARLLLDGQSEQLNKKQREYLQLIMENADQMNDLVDALLTFSRVTRQVAHMTKVDVHTLVQSIVEQEERAIGAPGNSSAVSVNIGELPDAMADPVLLRQVFANLISNALKSTRMVPEPRIEIGARVEEDSLIYFVSNNGVGFSPAAGKKLFDVFQHLHAQSQFEGTGVGLASVRKIVERHGGKVWAEGEEGKGATFYVALPRQPVLPASTPQLSTMS